MGPYASRSPSSSPATLASQSLQVEASFSTARKVKFVWSVSIKRFFYSRKRGHTCSRRAGLPQFKGVHDSNLPLNLNAGYPEQYTRKAPDAAVGIEPVVQALNSVRCKFMLKALHARLLPVPESHCWKVYGSGPAQLKQSRNCGRNSMRKDSCPGLPKLRRLRCLHIPQQPQQDSHDALESEGWLGGGWLPLPGADPVSGHSENAGNCIPKRRPHDLLRIQVSLLAALSSCH